MPNEPADKRDLIALGVVVRRLREQQNVTQRQLAAASGVHWRTIVRIEHGESPATIGNLFGVAAALGTRLSVIIAEAEPDEEADER